MEGKRSSTENPGRNWIAWKVENEYRKMKVYSPAKHHRGVGRGLTGPSVGFKPVLEEERRGKGVSLWLEPFASFSRAQPQWSAVALVNKPPTYQWSSREISQGWGLEQMRDLQNAFTSTQGPKFQLQNFRHSSTTQNCESHHCCKSTWKSQVLRV